MDLKHTCTTKAHANLFHSVGIIRLVAFIPMIYFLNTFTVEPTSSYKISVGPILQLPVQNDRDFLAQHMLALRYVRVRCIVLIEPPYMVLRQCKIWARVRNDTVMSR